MFDLDPGKLLLIGVVAILVLGPDKLPDAAHRVGATWRSFNEFRHRMEAEVRSTIPDLPASGELARLARSPAALLDHLGEIGAERVDVPEAHADPPVGDSASIEATQPSAADSPGHVVAGAVVSAESPSATLAVALGDANLN